MSVKWTHTKEALSALESKLKCFICDKLPVDPQLLWCKHSFCSSCIQGSPVCPKCQFPTSPQEMVPDIILGKLLRAMRTAAEVSKRNEEQEIQINPTLTSQKDLNPSKINVQKIDKKTTNSLKLSQNRSNERKSEPEVEKENMMKSVGIKVRAVRRSSRNCSLGNSPEKKEQEFPELVRRSSRGGLPRSDKPESVEKNNVKTKSQKLSPNRLSNRHVMSTPKPKLTPKSSTPILYSAKKVQHANKVNPKGETPLQIACRQGKLSLVQKLLSEGAQPNVKDYANWTPLCDAVGSGNLDVVQALLQAGAGINTPANLNTTALVEAVVRRDKAMVELLMRHGADMHQRTALGNSALSVADEEMRELMLRCDHVSPPLPPCVPVEPRAVLVDAQLPPPKLERLMEFCRRFNLSLSTEFTDEITHVVVEKTAANTCKPSTAVMLAIVSGCSVTGMDWVKKCLEAGKLVAVEEFEPCGTTDYPTSDVFNKARVNKERLLPRLFDGCHMSLQHDQPWPRQLKADTVALISAAGAVYQPRQCDPERVPAGEATVMYHTAPTGPLGALSHVILYQAGAQEPLLKYNMAHVKSLPLTWFYKCIQTFSVEID